MVYREFAVCMFIHTHTHTHIHTYAHTHTHTYIHTHTHTYGVAQSVLCLTTDSTIGVRSPTEAEDFSSSLCVQTGSGAHPAPCPMGTGGPFPGGKARPRRDADHSPPSSDEIEMSRSYSSSPQAPSWRVAGQLYFLLLHTYIHTCLYVYMCTRWAA
jgi:hypothetical protein